MRSKEDAHDYRYFPDPDLPPLVIEPARVERVRAGMPELPAAMQARFAADYGLSAYDAGLLTASLDTARYFEAVTVAAGTAQAKQAANWVMGEVAARLNREEKSIAASPLSPEQLASVLARVADGTISNNIARKVFDALWDGEGDSADAIIEAQGLKQVTDASAIEPIIDEVLAANAQSVAEFKAGRGKAFNALVGHVMKATRGKASPARVNQLLRRKLEA
jgi:aspartyl-tRNA(Asn)/glutamyl-tRNA(Gln) amidotransferase subunit B